MYHLPKTVFLTILFSIIQYFPALAEEKRTLRSYGWFVSDFRATAVVNARDNARRFMKIQIDRLRARPEIKKVIVLSNRVHHLTLERWRYDRSKWICAVWRKAKVKIIYKDAEGPDGLPPAI